MTSDCYAILGVTPVAEDVVIGAAYRALMRHYHPDTNRDPEAQARAREITAAYSVLRDPSSRARYDAQRAAGPERWAFDEPVQRPPPMRALGIVTALLAVALVGAVWSWAPPEPAPKADPPASQAGKTGVVAPAIELKPESERLAMLAGKSGPAPSAGREVAAPPLPPAAEPVEYEAPQPLPPPARTPRLRAPQIAAQSTVPKPAAVEGAKPAAKDERIATLDRMSAGFFSQSMANADAGKKSRLIAAHDRSAAERKACRSDTCVADAYVRQIRETSAIMQARAGPAN